MKIDIVQKTNLDDAVRHIELAAEGGKPDNDLKCGFGSWRVQSTSLTWSLRVQLQHPRHQKTRVSTNTCILQRHKAAWRHAHTQDIVRRTCVGCSLTKQHEACLVSHGMKPVFQLAVEPSSSLPPRRTGRKVSKTDGRNQTSTGVTS